MASGLKNEALVLRARNLGIQIWGAARPSVGGEEAACLVQVLQRSLPLALSLSLSREALSWCYLRWQHRDMQRPWISTSGTEAHWPSTLHTHKHAPNVSRRKAGDARTFGAGNPCHGVTALCRQVRRGGRRRCPRQDVQVCTVARGLHEAWQSTLKRENCHRLALLSVSFRSAGTERGDCGGNASSGQKFPRDGGHPQRANAVRRRRRRRVAVRPSEPN